MIDLYIKELKLIYESEINFSISCFWDGGFIIKIGDDMNGWSHAGYTKTIEEAIQWLVESVMSFFPNSDYAQKRRVLINKIRSGHVNTDKFTFEFLQKMLYSRQSTKIGGDNE